MRRDEAIRIIREHEAELRAMGVESIELFGSVARDEAGPDSDVDVLVGFDQASRPTGLAFFRRYIELQEKLTGFLGREVDVATLPLTKHRFESQIAGERIAAY